jgi:hypothetical protein
VIGTGKPWYGQIIWKFHWAILYKFNIAISVVNGPFFCWMGLWDYGPWPPPHPDHCIKVNMQTYKYLDFMILFNMIMEHEYFVWLWVSLVSNNGNSIMCSVLDQISNFNICIICLMMLNGADFNHFHLVSLLNIQSVITSQTLHHTYWIKQQGINNKCFGNCYISITRLNISGCPVVSDELIREPQMLYSDEACVWFRNVVPVKASLT